MIHLPTLLVPDTLKTRVARSACVSAESIPEGDRTMTAENFERVLTGLTRQTPFRLFTVELHGGQRFEVDHPGALVHRDGVAVFLAPGGIPIWFDHESVNQIIGDTAGVSL
jgi:hypothetical protein